VLAIRLLEADVHCLKVSADLQQAASFREGVNLQFT
jgi:hypothetical protein